MRWPRLFAICSLVAIAGMRSQAAEPEAERVNLLEQMRTLAKQTKIRLAKDEQPAEFVSRPVFRYDDQPRKFIDATMWVWTRAGRPVAVQKIEAMVQLDTAQPLWGYCFTSLADQPLTVEWPERKPYVATEPGLAQNPLPDAPYPSVSSVGRTRQMRELARDFSARITLNPKTSATAEMRLLPTPLLEFADDQSKLVCGGIFGFSSNGTNPDLLLHLEAKPGDAGLAWHVSPVRMTTGGLQLKYRGKPIWEAEFVNPNAGPFSNWVFFRTPREENPE